MIILTDAQADLVRGLTTRGNALVPRPLADGTWALPEAVLNDPAHLRLREYLLALPTVRDNTIRAGERTDPNNPGSPIINTDWSQDDVLLRDTNYSQTWQEGQVVARPRP